MKKNSVIVFIGLLALLVFMFLNEYFRTLFSDKSFKYYTYAYVIIFSVVYILLWNYSKKNQKKKEFLIYGIGFPILSVILYLILN